MERIGVIGLGSIATRHRRNIRQHFPSACIISMPARGLLPTNQKRVENADQLVESVTELMRCNIQCAIVASPASLHLQHAQGFIKAGIPVLIEKPLSASIEDAYELAKLVHENHTRVAIGYCLRFLPSSAVVKQVINEQRLGQLYNVSIEVGQYLPSWRPDIDYRQSVSAQRKCGGGALLELSHELDLAQWLLGNLTLEHAILRSMPELDTDVEDCVDLLLSNSSKVIAHVHLDFLQRTPYRRWRIVGSGGSLEWDLILNTVTTISISGKKEILYSAPEWDKNQMYTQQFEAFICSSYNKEKPLATVDGALSIIELIEAIKRYPLIQTTN